MQNLSLGSHIKTYRTGYSHHGIYCGNGQVVHYSGFAQAFKKGSLEITTLERFLGSEKKYYVIKYPANKVMFSAKDIVRRALSRVGEDRYNLVFNNCEHFAAWCVTGKSESKQVKAALTHTSTIAIVYKSINTASAATRAVGLAAGTANIFTGTTATSGLAIGKLAGCTTGALGGAVVGSSSAAVGTTALIGTSSAIAGSSAAVGFTAAVGGGTLTVAAAPVIVPVALAVGACAVVGGFLGGFFD
ncbi:lecithin retinol acyltransferase family protein [Psychrobacter faecalis]